MQFLNQDINCSCSHIICMLKLPCGEMKHRTIHWYSVFNHIGLTAFFSKEHHQFFSRLKKSVYSKISIYYLDNDYICILSITRQPLFQLIQSAVSFIMALTLDALNKLKDLEYLNLNFKNSSTSILLCLLLKETKVHYNIVKLDTIKDHTIKTK